MSLPKTHLEIHLQSRPQGLPRKEDFAIAEVAVPELDEGEILIQNEWISVDPYMRGRMNDSKSYVPPFALGAAMDGGCVGRVVSSRHASFAVGDFVVGNKGWRQFWKSDGRDLQKVDAEAAEPKSYLSILGMTGMTAWVGLNEIGKLKENETVFVSAASGAVGSIVSQIAKLKGCRVIGSAGSADKIKWLKDKAGVDEAFNYHEVDDISARLAQLAPEGIDLYFDNVGGDHLAGAIEAMNNFGRIVCCGMISGYNDKKPKPGPANLSKIIGKRIRMEGFIVRDHQNLQEAFLKEMTGWIQSGRIVWEETITEGLENAPQAFISLFEGDKMGKAIVKV